MLRRDFAADLEFGSRLAKRVFFGRFLFGSVPARINGVMVSTDLGRTTAYALDNLQDRGILFVGAAEQVYEGQIVGVVED